MKNLISACALALCSFVSPLHAGQAHVHGTASLHVVIDGNLLQLALDSPLDSLVGFEHAPRTARQKQALQTLVEQFNQPHTLFVPSPAARCVAQPVRLRSPLLDDKSKPAAKPVKKATGHASLEAAITFKCAAPAALRDIEVKLFASFPGMRRLDAQVAGPRGQSTLTLTPGKSRLSW